MGLHGVSVGDITKSLDYEARPPGQGLVHIDPSVDSTLETLRQWNNHRCDIVGAGSRTHEIRFGHWPRHRDRDPTTSPRGPTREYTRGWS